MYGHFNPIILKTNKNYSNLVVADVNDGGTLNASDSDTTELTKKVAQATVVHGAGRLSNRLGVICLSAEKRAHSSFEMYIADVGMDGLWKRVF